MIIEPKVRDFLCLTAHPKGCKEAVRQQIEYTKKAGSVKGPKKVLVIGASTGYGLASRIAVTYGCDADTLGIMFERPATEKRTATPGWYNTEAFESFAAKDGHYAKTINGDAFSAEIKEQTVARIKEDLGQVDMVIYSLAAPRRETDDGTVYNSVLKTTSADFTNKSLDLRTNMISEATITAATEEEIQATVKVMGGEDWFDWISVLTKAGVLAPNAMTIAYSYIGPKLTYPVYYQGTIGQAKQHLYDTAKEMNEKFKAQGVKAYVSVNKALVTQASSAIPIVPLYMAVMYRVMKKLEIHEGCIEQMNRLFHDRLSLDCPPTDEEGRIRMDDYEMKPEVQSAIMEIWEQIDSSNVKELADLDGYWEDFYHMFGFHFDKIDYSEDIVLV